MTERTLHLQVSSGLASRMRAVVGALAYCQSTERRLIVDWPRKEPSETLGTFDAKFRDLWSNDIEETDCGKRFLGLRLDNPEMLETDAHRLELRTCHIEPFLKWMPENRPEMATKRLSPSIAVREIIDSKQFSFLACPQTRRQSLPLPADIASVGINIRYALKQPSVAEPEWFIERMRQFPDAVFFCALDSLSVEQQLRAEFRNRIICQRKDYAYDRAGIIKTCADLYLLAACDYVIGSNYSSYSQMVAFLRGAQYVGPHDKPGRGLIGGDYEDLWNPPEATECCTTATHSAD